MLLTQNLHGIAKRLAGARRARLAGNVISAAWNEEKAEESLRNLFEACGLIADLVAAAVKAQLIDDGAPIEDLNGACDGDSVEFLIDALMTAWELSMEFSPLDCEEWTVAAQVLEASL